MPGKNFFEEEEETTEEQVQDAPETIKLGDKEYSQDELSRLVGLGEMAAEAEEKYKTKIDRVYPEFTKATQERSDLKRQIEELQAKVNQPSVNPVTGELTAEEKELAIKQLEALGVGPKSFEERTRQIYREEMAANELLSNVSNIIEGAKENGQPTTTQEELLNFMTEQGIRNPSTAYKLMFEKELDQIKEQKLSQIKPSGMTTINSSTAGGKAPAPTKAPRNSEELRNAVQSLLGGE